MNKQKKADLLNALYKKYTKKEPCHLGYQERKNIVFGEGNPDSPLLLLGEAPGREEDEQGRPFVGRAGKLLNKILSSLEIDRNDIFITNAVKCRPPHNRKPTPEEINKCKELFLKNQIEIIKPKVICTLGVSPYEALFSKSIQITKQHGIPEKWNNITIIPTLHPAYILRNPNKVEQLMNDLEKAWILSK